MPDEPVVDATPDANPLVEADASQVIAETPAEPEVESDDIWSDPVKAKDAATRARQEAAERRIKLKEYEERYAPFESYDEDDRAIWTQLANDLLNDPKKAAQQFQTIAQNILDTAADPNATDEQVEEAVGEYLTKDQLEKYLAEKQQEAAIDAEAQNLLAKARELGYPDRSPEQRLLMTVAANETNGDVIKAHEFLEAQAQARFDKFVEKQSKLPRSPNDGGTPASNEAGPPKTLEEAKRRTIAFMEANQDL